MPSLLRPISLVRTTVQWTESESNDRDFINPGGGRLVMVTARQMIGE
jgi:hypothetical protein